MKRVFLKENSTLFSIKGTRSEDIIKVLEKLPMESRKQVKEIIS